MDDSTPRITSQYLENFQHKTIRIVGRVTELHGDSAFIDSEGQVKCILNRTSHLSMNHAVEIIGKVQNDLSIRVLDSTDLGPGVDFSAYAAVVDATHRYRDIFYGSHD